MQGFMNPMHQHIRGQVRPFQLNSVWLYLGLSNNPGPQISPLRYLHQYLRESNANFLV